MTPQEKALELAMKFDRYGETDNAVACALICIDEQLELINTINNDGADDYYEDILQIKEALEQLKQN